MPAELDWLSRLTTTDGMTVILPDLTVLAFGVFVETRKLDGVRVREEDSYSPTVNQGTKRLSELAWGARHQSAAFAGNKVKGATCIVASADGTLSTMQWDEKDEVGVVRRHLELLVDV
jgi:hypothetical protein